MLEAVENCALTRMLIVRILFSIVVVTSANTLGGAPGTRLVAVDGVIGEGVKPQPMHLLHVKIVRLDSVK